MAMKKIRNYEVSIWTLQDSFITVLKYATLENKGQIQQPQITLIDDGTQEFNFKIPMYLYQNGEKKQNPIWYNTTNGNIIADLRKIKVIINKNGTQLDSEENENNQGVFQFIITKVTETHENNILTCQVHCQGLAFHELGKLGYKIQLSSDQFYRQDLQWWKSYNGNKGNYPDSEEDLQSQIQISEEQPKATLKYWNDKIFKYNGQWKYNWQYEISMDWTGYRLGDIARDSHQVYQDSYVSSWGYSEKDDTLTPRQVQLSKPKERMVDLKESNIYNLTQSLAETFGVYCKYVYQHDNNYHITKRKVVYYNNFLNEEYGFLDLTYPYNTSSISRQMDAIDVVTKMFIQPVTSETSSDGYLTIMNSDANKSKQDYLLNFDYLYGIGAISKQQYEAIEKYELQMRRLNEILIPLAAEIVDIQQQKVQVDANVTIYENAIALDKQRMTSTDNLLNNLTGGTGILHVTKDRPDTGVLLDDTSTPDNTADCYLKLNQKGILPETLHIYRNYSYMSSDDNRLTDEIKGLLEYDDYNNLIAVRRIIRTNTLSGTNDRRTVYLTYDYQPSLYYENVKKTWEARLKNDTIKYNENKSRQEKLTQVYGQKQQLYNNTVKQKEDRIHEFQNMMGPALRQGYWMPDDYEDYGDMYSATFNDGFSLGKKIWDYSENRYKQDAYGNIIYEHDDPKYNDAGGYATVMWDRVPFDGQQLCYYQQGASQEKKFFPCIKLRQQHLDFIQKNKDVSLIFYDQASNQVFQNIRSFSIGSQCQLGFLTDNNKVFPVLFITGADSFTQNELKCMQGKGDRRSYSNSSNTVTQTTTETEQSEYYTQTRTIDGESKTVKIKKQIKTTKIVKKNSLGEKLSQVDITRTENKIYDEVTGEYNEDNPRDITVKTVQIQGNKKTTTEIDKDGKTTIVQKIVNSINLGLQNLPDQYTGDVQNGIEKDYIIDTFNYEEFETTNNNIKAWNITGKREVKKIWYNTLNAELYSSVDVIYEEENDEDITGTKTIQTTQETDDQTNQSLRTVITKYDYGQNEYFKQYNKTIKQVYLSIQNGQLLQSRQQYNSTEKENKIMITYINNNYQFIKQNPDPNIDYTYSYYEYEYDENEHNAPTDEDLKQRLIYYVHQQDEPQIAEQIIEEEFIKKTRTIITTITQQESQSSNKVVKTIKTDTNIEEVQYGEVNGNINPNLKVTARLGIITYDTTEQNDVKIIQKEGSILINPKYIFKIQPSGIIEFTEQSNSDWIDAGETLSVNNIYKYQQVFPRIQIKSSSLKDNSSQFSFVYDNYNLKMYSDYSILNRHGLYYINPKISVLLQQGIIQQPEENEEVTQCNIKIENDSITLGEIKIYYSLSNADTAIYLDAIQVLKQNAYPKVSYQINVNIANQNFVKYDYNKMGYIAHINDNQLKFENVMGYISEIHLMLDRPWEDEITIKNYKTKFQDLFSKIVASTQQMQKNEYVIGLASDAFSKDGTISSQTLSSSIMKVDLNYAFNNGKLTINEKDGIWGISDSGVVAYRGGGIFTATSKNSDGNWIWNTGITPEGINADLITTGQLDTSRIKIYSGSRLRFQWNGQGLYAYKSFKQDVDVISYADDEQVKQKLNNYIDNQTDGYSRNEYVKFTQNGLFLMTENGATVYSAQQQKYKTLNRQVTRVEVSWQGFKLRNWNNDQVFYADPDTGNLVLDGTIYASAGKIGGFTIGDKYLSTNNKNSFEDSFGVTGVYLGDDGIALGGGQFSVNSSGYLVAHEGFIGNWRLSKGILYSVPDGDNNEPDWEQGIVLNAAGSNLSSNQIYTIWAGAQEPQGVAVEKTYAIVDSNGNPIYDLSFEQQNGNYVYIRNMDDNGQQIQHTYEQTSGSGGRFIIKINNITACIGDDWANGWNNNNPNYLTHEVKINGTLTNYHIYLKNDGVLEKNSNNKLDVYITIPIKTPVTRQVTTQSKAPFRLKRSGELYTRNLYADEVYSACVQQVTDGQQTSYVQQYVSIGNLFTQINKLKSLGLTASTSSNGRVTLTLTQGASKTVNFNSAGSVYVSNVSGGQKSTDASTITVNAHITLSNNKSTDKDIQFTPSGWTKGTFTKLNVSTITVPNYDQSIRLSAANSGNAITLYSQNSDGTYTKLGSDRYWYYASIGAGSVQYYVSNGTSTTYTNISPPYNSSYHYYYTTS